MHDCCAAANLPLVFCDGSLPEAVQDIWPAFQEAFREKNRGTRLNDIMAFRKSGAFQVSVAAKPPNPHEASLLLAKQYLKAHLTGCTTLSACFDVELMFYNL
jgi:hypothetical protein